MAVKKTPQPLPTMTDDQLAQVIKRDAEVTPKDIAAIKRRRSAFHPRERTPEDYAREICTRGISGNSEVYGDWWALLNEEQQTRADEIAREFTSFGEMVLEYLRRQTRPSGESGPRDRRVAEFQTAWARIGEQAKETASLTRHAPASARSRSAQAVVAAARRALTTLFDVPSHRESTHADRDWQFGRWAVEDGMGAAQIRKEWLSRHPDDEITVAAVRQALSRVRDHVEADYWQRRLFAFLNGPLPPQASDEGRGSSRA